MNLHSVRPDRTSGPEFRTDAAVDRSLREAIEAAGRAPSMFRLEPWRWQLNSHQLELRADQTRQLTAVDPHGRMLTLGCGIALDHALVALAASGQWASVDRFPVDEPGLVARIVPSGTYEPTATDTRLLRAMTERRTDQHPFSSTPVPAGTIDRLRRMAESWGVYVTELDPECLVDFHVFTARAGELGQSQAAHQGEVAASTRRRIPLRALCPEGHDLLLPGPGEDGGARYLVLWSPGDDPASWLAAGEVTSSILLDATVAELDVSPMSDVVETPISRTLVHSLLGNRGYAHAVLRIGMPVADQPTPPAPRRAAEDLTPVDRGRC